MGIASSSGQSEVQKLLREINYENKTETMARLKELKASGVDGTGEMKYDLMKRTAALEVSNVLNYLSNVHREKLKGPMRSVWLLVIYKVPLR